MNIQFNLKKTLILSFILTGLTSSGIGAPYSPFELTEYMRANLYVVAADNSTSLVDGNLTHYNNNYSNNVDWDDAWKLNNFGENFGILRSGVTLVIERRQKINDADTSRFRMWNMQVRNYMVEIITQNCNHPDLIAYLEDTYMHTTTAVNTNGITQINFSVTSDPASASEARFQLIFKNNLLGPTPVTFTGLQLLRKKNGVQVDWKVENEYSMERYVMERSSDGKNFNGMQNITPFNSGNNHNYSTLDPIGEGDHYYRIKGISLSGQIQFSAIARIKPRSSDVEFGVYPNPVIDKTIQLHSNTVTEGKITVLLYNNNGSLPYRTTIQVPEGQSTNSLQLPKNLQPGIYKMKVVSGDNSTKTMNISIL